MSGGKVRGVVCLGLSLCACYGSDWWDNPTLPDTTTTPGPSIRFLTPQPYGQVFGSVEIRVQAWVAQGTPEVRFSVDHRTLGLVREPPYVIEWTVPAGSGIYELAADVVDEEGRRGSDQIQVTAVDTPAVAFEEPANGAVVSGEVSLWAMTKNNPQNRTVEYLIDGNALATVSPGSGIVWNTLDVSNDATHVLEAIATDDSGEQFSARISVTVKNPQMGVTLVDPTPDSNVAGTTLLTATTPVGSGVDEVQFFIDAQLIGTARQPPFQVEWNTLPWDNGGYHVIAVADGAGGQTSKAVVYIHVDN